MHRPPKDATAQTPSHPLQFNYTRGQKKRKRKRLVAKHRLQERLSRLPNTDKGLCNPFIQTSLYSSRPELTAVWGSYIIPDELTTCLLSVCVVKIRKIKE